MRSVEDETDAAAAAALEQENAAELAEFTVEPAARVRRTFDCYCEVVMNISDDAYHMILLL